MTQNEFFNTLMDGLKDLPEEKLHDIVSDYEHNFDLGLASGKTEEEIINELGNPDALVKKYRNEHFNIQNKSEDLVDNTAINKNSDDITFSENSPVNINNESKDVDMNISDNINDDFTNNENVSTDDDFYNLHNSNISSDNIECNSKSLTSNILDNYSNNNNAQTNSNYNFKNNSSNNNSNSFSNNHSDKSSQTGVNNILKICIIILALIIFFPVITGIIGFVIGLLGIAVSIFVASIGVLVGGTFTSLVGLPNVPAFVANFPYPVIVLFSLGSISLSIFLTLLFYYLCKFFIQLFIRIYTSLKNKGGSF